MHHVMMMSPPVFPLLIVRERKVVIGHTKLLLSVAPLSLVSIVVVFNSTIKRITLPNYGMLGLQPSKPVFFSNKRMFWSCLGWILISAELNEDI